jgi:hypothetical protein
MTISAITPPTNSTIDYGDSWSFTIDDTYTSLVIRAQTSTALVKVYDTADGGAQSGYSVEVVDNGATHTFTITADSGWDESPQLLYVIENESGASTTTSISYVLTGNAPYPQGTHPYNAEAEEAAFTVAEGNTIIRTDVDTLEFDADDFNVIDDGEGHVIVEGVFAGATDHGALSGLGDNDHPQYLLVANYTAPRLVSQFGGWFAIPASPDASWISWAERGQGDQITNYSSNYGQGTDPAAIDYEARITGWMAPQNLLLKSMRLRVATADYTPSPWILRVYKHTMANAASTATWTQLGSDFDLDATIVANQTAYLLSQSGLSVAVSAGDIVMCFVRSSGGAINMYASLVCEYEYA